jgi:hypothetical protein
MEYLIITLKAIAAYVVLMFFGVNLVGGIVRGFVTAKAINNDSTAKQVYGKAGDGVSFVFIFLLVAYLFALYYYFNIWVLIGAIVLIAGRIPDLIWEIRTGQKTNLKNMRKSSLSVFLTILDWAVLPLLWYAFYIG